MPVSQQITKAYLQPISWNAKTGLTEPEVGQADEERFYVQFNPQSLKVNYANQKAGEGQPGKAPIQFVGKGTTKLTVELLFDVTGPTPNGSDPTQRDVRDLTQRVAKFLEPLKEGGGEKGQHVPPGIRFGWDTFTFEGVVDSMDETLDFFSNEGKPLRATVALQISKQEIKVTVPEGSPGTSPQHEVLDGETLQQAAAGAGRDDWQNVAAANGIENPRMMQAGALVDLKAGASLSAGVSAGASRGVRAGLSIGAANNLSLGVASGLGYGASSRTSLSGGFGAGTSLGGSASVSASTSASASLTGGASSSLSTRIR